MCSLSYLLKSAEITGDFTIEAIYRDPNNPYDAFCLGASSGTEWDKKKTQY